MSPHCVTLTLNSPDETADLAARLAARLGAGDTLLLEGDIGAGKTHFARCAIRSLLTQQEDIPSPTFTLVQTYHTQKGEVWHADLYRLLQADDAVELGLEEAMEEAICLIEWPDRLGDLTPPDSLTIRLKHGIQDDQRLASLSWTDPKWQAKLSGIADV